MTEKIIIAGAGGQGIMLLGKIIAETAMRENKHVTWLPAYGAEVRGGTAHCMVIISDQEIGSPYIKKADTLIIMNQPSFEKFKGYLISDGFLIVNSSLAEESGYPKKSLLLKHPFTEIAIELGNIKVANMVALGLYIAGKKIITLQTVLDVIEDFAPEDKKGLIEVNYQALSRGLQLIKDK
jgi:2-oxoglutarate ferredoxin oxidoreductase subunit gamma